MTCLHKSTGKVDFTIDGYRIALVCNDCGQCQTIQRDWLETTGRGTVRDWAEAIAGQDTGRVVSIENSVVTIKSDWMVFTLEGKRYTVEMVVTKVENIG